VFSPGDYREETEERPKPAGACALTTRLYINFKSQRK
jgi:hypothetical protein